jgi:hypothetical protein
MNRFNHYFANDFKACRLLAYARDHCRNRDVRLYQIPGQMECVGVSDGTDSWIAPAVESIFSVNVKQMLRDISDGKPVPSPRPLASSRVRLEEAEDPEPPLRTRRVKLDDDQPTKRSTRVLLA